jgi:hypothetical protein
MMKIILMILSIIYNVFGIKNKKRWECVYDISSHLFGLLTVLIDRLFRPTILLWFPEVYFHRFFEHRNAAFVASTSVCLSPVWGLTSFSLPGIDFGMPHQSMRYHGGLAEWP